MRQREDRQREAVDAFLNSDRKSILLCCPRFGKIRCALTILEEGDYQNPMILMPRLDILDGWLSEFKKVYEPDEWNHGTFLSIKKREFKQYDIIIIDEPHEMSVNQQRALADRLPPGMPVLGLTGTMTQKTRNELYNNLGLDVCYKYSIDDGVREGILADYQIYIHEVPLFKEEKRHFNTYLHLRDENIQNARFFDLKIINLLQNSQAKLVETRKLIARPERILVFCGVTKIADDLGIPVYHSKAKEKKIFDQFCSGQGDKLATIKMMQAGVTVTPIHMGVINYMSGNPEDGAQKICRFLGFEFDNPGKKADIHIVSSTEQFETGRLKTGLQFFNNNKIHYVSNNQRPSD